MTPTATDILDDVLTALRATGAFAWIGQAGPDQPPPALPAVRVGLLGHTTQPADDGASLWHELRLELALRTDAPRTAAALGKALELLGRARSALLADPFRGGRTCHLPIGRATELGPVVLGTQARPPLCELRFDLTCRYEEELE